MYHSTSSLQSKRAQFAISIRRQQKEKYKNQIRKKFTPINQEIKISDLIKQFELENDEGFKMSETVSENKPFVLVNIMKARQINLIRVSFNGVDMQDEKITCQSLDGQKVHPDLPTQYPFQTHTRLYDALAKDIFENQGKYKEQVYLLKFFLNFLARNKYQQTMRQKQYHKSIIGLLELLVLELQDNKFKKRILSWVSGTQALTLIYNCICQKTESFAINSYQYLYDIVQQGMESTSKQKQFEAVDVLRKLVMKSDWDQIESLHKHKPAILNRLLAIIDANINQNQVDSKHRKCIANLYYTLVIMLDTYESVKINCMRDGVGYIAAQLICSRNQNQIIGGLRIMRMLCDTSGNEVAEFLMNNYTIQETGIWKVLGSEAIINHESQELRKQYSQFLYNFISNSEFNEIQQMCLQLTEKVEDFIDLFVNTFVKEEDMEMMENSLLNLKSLLYYAGNQEYNGTTDTTDKCYFILNRIFNSQMKNKLKKIQKQSEKYKVSPFVQACQGFLDYIETREKQSKDRQI